MKNTVIFTCKILLLICGLLGSLFSPIFAQSQEAQQLLLNVEKLTQFKNILNDMKQGYQVLSSGYNAVRDISQGTFSLHQVFLDGLMMVSPEVRKYPKIIDIINHQKDILTEYNSTISRLKNSGNFSVSELDYLGDVYLNLLNGSLDKLDELSTILTNSSLRMSDDERLKSIDRIDAAISSKLSFLRRFNNQAILLGLQRSGANQELNTLQKIYQP